MRTPHPKASQDGCRRVAIGERGLKRENNWHHSLVSSKHMRTHPSLDERQTLANVKGLKRIWSHGFGQCLVGVTVGQLPPEAGDRKAGKVLSNRRSGRESASVGSSLKEEGKK